MFGLGKSANGEDALHKRRPDDIGRYAHDDPTTSLFEHFAWGGMLYSGFWRDRPHDQIGLGITYYKISPSLAHTEKVEQQFGLPATHPFGVHRDAMVFEANYGIDVYRGILIQPEVEYFLNPGGVSSVRDALVFGVKTHLLF